MTDRETFLLAMCYVIADKGDKFSQILANTMILCIKRQSIFEDQEWLGIFREVLSDKEARKTPGKCLYTLFNAMAKRGRDDE